MEQSKKKMGRPVRWAGEGPSPNISFRCRPSRIEQLRTEAAATGYSVSEIIERALEAHFTGADVRAVVRSEIRAVLEDSLKPQWRAPIIDAADPARVN